MSFLSYHMHSHPTPGSLALFCKVVDNYGDIGICWRLARQLQQEHGVAVTLWVDDLYSFQRLCPQVRTETESQSVAGVTIRHWRNQDSVFSSVDIADIVIEFFGCNIPPGYINAMAQCTPKPVWLNLEGLTAETWVEGCHTLPSPHPSLPLLKHFFFPGFNQRTGGLLMETGIEQQRQQFQHPDNAPAMSDFLGRLGVPPTAMDSLKISLFCYPHAPVQELFAAWQQSRQPVICLVPEGVGGAAVEQFLGQAAKAGASACHDALTVLVVPFVTQPEYDRLLWACDLNFVRGEDSFVRAQLAGRPFVWHIYPQDENLHHVKLRAFLHIHAASTPALAAVTLAWNAVTTGQDWSALWYELATGLPELARLAPSWQQQLLANGDLASNLCRFAQTLTRK